MAYYPYIPITWVNRFIERMRINPNATLTSNYIKNMGIPNPGRLLKSFLFIDLISDEGNLTDLGKKFIDFRTRKEACREILEKPPYDELVYRMKNGEFLSRKELRVFFEGMLGWTVDPIDKTITLFLYFLKNAGYDEFEDVDFIQKTQTSPRPGTRKGIKNIKEKE